VLLSDGSSTLFVTASVTHWVGGGPATGEGVVITPAEADKAEVPVVQASCEADGDSQGRGPYFLPLRGVSKCNEKQQD